MKIYKALYYKECDACGTSGVEKDFIIVHGIMKNLRCDLTLCPDCIASLHSITSPLSILVQTGINTKEK